MNNNIENEDIYDADLITLTDEDGNEFEFEVMDEIDYKDGHYYALLPLFDDPENEISQDDTYMIFEAVEDENGDPQLAEIEDDDLLDELAEIFEAKMNDAEGDVYDNFFFSRTGLRQQAETIKRKIS